MASVKIDQTDLSFPNRPLANRLAALAAYTQHRDKVESGAKEKPDISIDPYGVLKPIREGDWDELEARLNAKADLAYRADISYDGELMDLRRIIMLEAQEGLLVRFNRYDEDRKRKLALQS